MEINSNKLLDPFITVVSPTYNEVDNIDEFLSRVKAAIGTLGIRYEILIIDNCSTDGTVDRLRGHAARDNSIKVILNARNFGHIRSPFHGILQANGDAVILLASDLQDPPELIPSLVESWRSGAKSVVLVKTDSDECWWMSTVRKIFYRLLARISDDPLIIDATGSGLYDKSVVNILRSCTDPSPYFRGLVARYGSPIVLKRFIQPKRMRGQTKNNLRTLIDLALFGIVSNSRAPIRVMTYFGVGSSFLSFLVGLYYLAMKLMYWDSFQMGVAPVLIGLFLFMSLQILFLGIMGEYLSVVHGRSESGLPRVIESERLNF